MLKCLRQVLDVIVFCRREKWTKYNSAQKLNGSNSDLYFFSPNDVMVTFVSLTPVLQWKVESGARELFSGSCPDSADYGWMRLNDETQETTSPPINWQETLTDSCFTHLDL